MWTLIKIGNLFHKVKVIIQVDQFQAGHLPLVDLLKIIWIQLKLFKVIRDKVLKSHKYKVKVIKQIKVGIRVMLKVGAISKRVYCNKAQVKGIWGKTLVIFYLSFLKLKIFKIINLVLNSLQRHKRQSIKLSLNIYLKMG